MNKRFDELKINNNNNTFNNKEIIGNNSRYIGQVVNGKPEGKGIIYYNDGGRYEGDFRNGKQEGKGITYFNNGDRYEGDFRNGNREGNGIYYYNNGDRAMGDYHNGLPIGRHAKLTKNEEITEEEKIDMRIKRKSRNYLEQINSLIEEKNKQRAKTSLQAMECNL